MQIFRKKTPLKKMLSAQRAKGNIIGLVPTMGALHEGHLSLVKEALNSCNLVVVSIFVNPTQFDNPKDLEKYPRNLEKDIELLESMQADIVVFSPHAQELYGQKVQSKHFDFGEIGRLMEGKHRQGHFDGVGTVIELLFQTIQPDLAFFGEKDYQQLQIIRKLTEIKQLPVKIIGCQILRESNGLARSSRNERLSQEEREKAVFLYKILKKAKTMLGTKSAAEVRNWVQTEFDKNNSFRLEYFEIANANSLKAIQEKDSQEPQRAFIAAYLGEIRLIDNLALNS